MSGLDLNDQPRAEYPSGIRARLFKCLIVLIVVSISVLLGKGGIRQLTDWKALQVAESCAETGLSTLSCQTQSASALHGAVSVDLEWALARTALREKDLSVASKHLESVVRQRPSWAYSWSALAAVHGITGDYDSFGRALSRASATGPSERNILLNHARLGSRYWNHLDTNTRRQLLNDIIRALHTNRFQTLQILFLERRESIVCGEKLKIAQGLAAWCQNIADVRDICRRKWHIPQARAWCASRTWAPDTRPIRATAP